MFHFLFLLSFVSFGAEREAGCRYSLGQGRAFYSKVKEDTGTKLQITLVGKAAAYLYRVFAVNEQLEQFVGSTAFGCEDFQTCKFEISRYSDIRRATPYYGSDPGHLSDFEIKVCVRDDQNVFRVFFNDNELASTVFHKTTRENFSSVGCSKEGGGRDGVEYYCWIDFDQNGRALFIPLQTK